MKKILVLLAVLSLIVGTAYAADLNEGLTRQVWNQAKGRSIVSDQSVGLRVWYTGSSAGTIGVSPNAVNLYENGVLTSASILTYRSIQRLTDYINTLDGWHAAIGPDSYGALSLGGGAPTAQLLVSPDGTVSAGGTKQYPTNVYLDTSYARRLFCGIEATEGKYNRIKSITAKYAATLPGTITIKVFDGDTIVWRKDTNSTPWNTAGDVNASPSTINFVDKTDKGLSSSMGKSLVCVVSADTATILSSPISTDKLTDHNISIVYDQF